MRMRWRELLFAHWSMDSAVLRPFVPAGLELDTFEGRCYLAAVPFLMENVSPRGAPAIPGLHAFPELNLRTYVTAGGKPGVWFFSLDAGQRLAVRVARRFFHLPYFDADFSISIGDAVHYRCRRTHRGAPSALFEATYRPSGAVYNAVPGTLDHWLTERYCLYSADPRGRIYRGEVNHVPWPLQPAQADIHVNTLGDWLGLPMPGQPELLHFAKSIDVHAWLIQRVS